MVLEYTSTWREADKYQGDNDDTQLLHSCHLSSFCSSHGHSFYLLLTRSSLFNFRTIGLRFKKFFHVWTIQLLTYRSVKRFWNVFVKKHSDMITLISTLDFCCGQAMELFGFVSHDPKQHAKNFDHLMTGPLACVLTMSSERLWSRTLLVFLKKPQSNLSGGQQKDMVNP